MSDPLDPASVDRDVVSLPLAELLKWTDELNRILTVSLADNGSRPVIARNWLVRLASSGIRSSLDELERVLGL